MSVSVSNLRAFWLVAQHGGFSAAARGVGLSQPTLTRQVKELEQGYGILLFERRARGLKLTGEGESLFPIVSRIFEQVSDAERFLKQQRQETIRIATVTTDVTTRMISAVQSMSQGLQLKISVSTSAGVYESLLNKTCDVGILTLPDGHQNMSSLEIGRYPLFAVLPAGHDLLNKESLSLKDLAQQPLITGSMASQARQHLDRAAVRAGVDLQIVQEIDAFEMIGELVRLGLGVGIMSYTGIVERNMANIRRIDECARIIPVHFACLAINRRGRVIDRLFSIVKLALIEGGGSPVTFNYGLGAE